MNNPTFTVLVAHHDNGWDTHVVETAGGNYMAWAGPLGDQGLTRYVEFDINAAKACAASDLDRKSGHHQCSVACTAWRQEFPAAFTGQPAIC